MDDKQIVELGLILAKHSAKAKSSMYNLDFDNLYSYLLEKFSTNVLPKLRAMAKDSPKYKPKAYITKCFNGYSLNFIRDCSKPVLIDRKYKDLYMQERAMLKRLPDATDSQIALECGTSLNMLYAMRKCMNTKFVSFDAMLNEPITENKFETMSYDEQAIWEAIQSLNDTEFKKAYAYFVDKDFAQAKEPCVQAIIELKASTHCNNQLPSQNSI